MPLDLTIVDWLLLGVVGFFAVTGLFRGMSGELASTVGLALAIPAGYFFHPLGMNLAKTLELAAGVSWWVAVVLDFTCALLVFGIVRKLVKRFVSFLVGQPTDAVLGLLSGVFKGAVGLGLLSGIGILQPGRYSENPMAQYSSIVRFVTANADSFVQGSGE